jgi:hypothetical protein
VSCIARVVVDGNVNRALNQLKKILVRDGNWRLIQYRSTDSQRTGHIGPAERRRIKSSRARKRQRKAAAKARAHTAMLDRQGLDDRVTAPHPARHRGHDGGALKVKDDGSLHQLPVVSRSDSTNSRSASSGATQRRNVTPQLGNAEHVALWRWFSCVAREPAAGPMAGDEVGQIIEQHGVRIGAVPCSRLQSVRTRT